MSTKVGSHVPQLAWAGLGLIAAVVCGWTVEALTAARMDPDVLHTAAYAAVWLPFLIALGLSYAGRSLRDSAGALGLRIRPLDLLWGVSIGCLARAADAFLRLLVAGSTGLSHGPTLSAVGIPGFHTIVLGVVAPVLVAPVLEEVYFRGLIQPRLAEALSRFGGSVRWAAAVVLTSMAFALVHVLLLVGAPAEALITGISTFFFALLAGTAAAATHRLGGAIVGHVVFNGLGILLTWPV